MLPIVSKTLIVLGFCLQLYSTANAVEIAQNGSTTTIHLVNEQMSHEVKIFCTSNSKELERNICIAAQITLRGQGFDVGRIDGIFDDRCRKKLITFQRRNRIPDHGHLDIATLRALNLV